MLRFNLHKLKSRVIGSTTDARLQPRTLTLLALLLLLGMGGYLLLGTQVVKARSIDEFMLNWAKAFQGAANTRGIGNGVAVDGAGNVITAGYFQDTVDFGGGDLVSNGQDDVFVAKLADDGSFVWARTAGGSNQDEAKAVAVDAAGNVYSTGRFRLTADFSPGGGGEITSNGNDDIFIYKLNADGSFGWVRGFGGSNIDEGWSIATDSASNVYVTGFFSGTVDFDPGNGTTELTSRDATNDIFTTSFDADGNFRWAKFISGASQRDRGDAIVATEDGVYVTGYFDNANTNFNPGGNVSAPYASDRDLFLVKYGRAGGFQWVKSIGGTGSDAGNSLAADAAGNIYVGGTFEDTITVEGITLTGNADGMRDVLVASYTPAGDFRWATSLTGTQRDEATGIAVGENGTIHITGFFGGTLAGGGTTLTSAGDRDIFVATLDDTGAVLELVGMGSAGEDQATAVAAGDNDALAFTGNFANTIDFDPGAEVANLTSQGTQSIFVSNWGTPGGDSNIYLPYTAKDSASSR